MNRRDAVFALLDGGLNGIPPQQYIPAAFFSHFAPEYHAGQAAVEKHREFFRATGMDLVKIQYERTFPRQDVQSPADWAGIHAPGLEFYEPQLEVVRGLVDTMKAEAPVIITLYSPLMCAGHVAGTEMLIAHMEQDPEAVQKGLRRITDSLMLFVDACIKIGLDGFYHSTQGGENHRFTRPDLFTGYVKPFDLEVMGEINQRCPFNVLHICDYHRDEYGGYDDLTPFLDYPGQIVNCNTEIGGRTMSPQEISDLFGRPFMGGMDRKGALSNGTPQQARAEARKALDARSGRFILGADCTVPVHEPWANLRAAIEEAHRFSA